MCCCQPVSRSLLSLAYVLALIGRQAGADLKLLSWMIDSLTPDDTKYSYMLPRNGWSFVWSMSCCPFSTKPLTEPALITVQTVWVKLQSKNTTILPRKRWKWSVDADLISTNPSLWNKLREMCMHIWGNKHHICKYKGPASLCNDWYCVPPGGPCVPVGVQGLASQSAHQRGHHVYLHEPHHQGGGQPVSQLPQLTGSNFRNLQVYLLRYQITDVYGQVPELTGIGSTEPVNQRRNIVNLNLRNKFQGSEM